MSDKGEVRRPQAVSKDEIKKFPRKKFLAGAAGAVGSILLGALALNKNRPLTPPQLPEIDLPPTEPLTRKDISNKILSLEYGSSERIKLERQLASNTHNLARIDQAFWVVSDFDIRTKLLHQRYELRQQGKEGLKPLTPEKDEWARKYKIHPEALAICEEAYEDALQIMDELQQKGIFLNDKPPARRLISPGGMGLITLYETSCFANIGEGFAARNLPSLEKVALNQLAKYTSILTGLNYTEENILGSHTGDIGFQMRPSTAQEAIKDINKTGRNTNIFDLKSSTVAAFIYLASRGYDSSNPVLAKEALTGWNQDLGREEKVAKGDLDYRTKFGASSI